MGETTCPHATSANVNTVFCESVCGTELSRTLKGKTKKKKKNACQTRGVGLSMPLSVTPKHRPARGPADRAWTLCRRFWSSSGTSSVADGWCPRHSGRSLLQLEFWYILSSHAKSRRKRRHGDSLSDSPPALGVRGRPPSHGLQAAPALLSSCPASLAAVHRPLSP